jgi:hypothetical protein
MKRPCTSARTFGSAVRPTAAHWVITPGADCHAATDQVRTEWDLSPEQLSGDTIGEFAVAAYAEFCPTATILGGIVAQEVVKIVTQRGHPMDNMFFLDIHDGKYPGTLHRNAALAAYKPQRSGPARGV